MISPKNDLHFLKKTFGAWVKNDLLIDPGLSRCDESFRYLRCFLLYLEKSRLVNFMIKRSGQFHEE